MKPIDNYFDAVPESLQRTNLIQKGIPQRILTEKRVDSMDYKPAGVKSQLLKIYAHCCAFCEKEVGKYDDIEHFRPKHEITGVNKVGYYWLGADWSNFVLGCKDCNGQENKGNHFPIRGIRATAPMNVSFSDLHQTNAFFEQCHALSAVLQAEQPLLLHPVLDNPDDYLVFEMDGTVSAKNQQEKGVVSIEIYGLSNYEKRPELIQARKDIVESVRKDIQHAVLNYINDQRLYQDLLYIRETLRDQIEYKKPFSAVRRACVKHFETFFIEPFNQSAEYASEHKVRLNRVYEVLEKDLREFDHYI
jgi:uncharacterized protein (TIGR02646 family)